MAGHEHPIYAQVLGDDVWCLECEQAGPTELWARNGWKCPVTGCQGGPLDTRPWERLREVNPHYPVRPVAGVVYPLMLDQGGS